MSLRWKSFLPAWNMSIDSASIRADDRTYGPKLDFPERERDSALRKPGSRASKFWKEMTLEPPEIMRVRYCHRECCRSNKSALLRSETRWYPYNAIPCDHLSRNVSASSSSHVTASPRMTPSR